MLLPLDPESIWYQGVKDSSCSSWSKMMNFLDGMDLKVECVNGCLSCLSAWQLRGKNFAFLLLRRLSPEILTRSVSRVFVLTRGKLCSDSSPVYASASWLCRRRRPLRGRYGKKIMIMCCVDPSWCERRGPWLVDSERRFEFSYFSDFACKEDHQIGQLKFENSES